MEFLIKNHKILKINRFFNYLFFLLNNDIDLLFKILKLIKKSIDKVDIKYKYLY